MKTDIKKVAPYKIVLTIAGVDYKSVGETIDEALVGLSLDWFQIKGKGIFKLKKGKLSLEHVFQKVLLKKIFANKIVRAMWAKRLGLLLKQTNG